MSQPMYERYGIPTVDFNEQAFMQGMGSRLVEAGLGDVTDELVARGNSRQFMSEPLSAERLRQINSTEALVIAEEAAHFAERVQGVEIRESGEPMVHLPTVADGLGYRWTFSKIPFHPACGEWAGRPRQFWARAGLVASLREVSLDLDVADIGLHFEDAFRPPGVQEGLFARRYKMALDEHPEWSHDQAILEAKSKTAFSARLASHKGGAAVDVRAVDLRTGRLFDIGHNYPDGGAHVALHSPLTTQTQWENRMVLASVAKQQGLEMFPFEDWHACAGDNTAAACAEGTELPMAIYGPVKKFDSTDGAILEVYDGPELDTVFDVRR